MPSAHLNVLRSYISDLLIDELAWGANAAPSRPPHAFPAALLFADISGSSELTRQIAGEGAAGIEELSQLFNDYFGWLIDVVADHGGDVVKFAGDALLAIWPCREGEELEDQALLAAGCSLAVQARVDAEASEAYPMATRVVVTAGDVTAMHLGGARDRWDLVVTGTPLSDLSTVKQIEPGRAAASAAAWRLIETKSQGTPLKRGLVELAAVDVDRPQRKTRARLTPAIAEHAETYLPGAIRSRIAAGQAAWLAELRRVTVLFVTLPSLTDPTSTQFAQDLMSRLQEVLYEREGSIDKLSEDDHGVSLLAAFGLPPYAHRDDAYRAVDAALALAEVLEADGVAASIGIATGPAFCGSVGNEFRREYSMIGDVVNVAARLAQAAVRRDAGTVGAPILCDAMTSQTTASQFEFTAVEDIEVGSADTVAAFRPLQPIEAEAPKAPLVGREQEETLLTDLLDRTRAGKGARLLIEGEPGIGKTRLAEFIAETGAHLGIRTLVGGAESIQRTAPYNAWRRIFLDILSPATRPGDPEISENIEKALDRLPGGRLGLAPLLNPILGIDFSETGLTVGLSPEGRAEATTELLTEVLAAATAGEPAVVLLEDGHWFDSASWRLARHVGRTADQLMMVITTRPMGEPFPADYRLLIEDGATVMPLTGLARPYIDGLVADRLGVERVPDDLSRLIAERTDGHPFFVEELTLALTQSGMIAVDSGRVRLEPTAETDVPTSVWGVIAERIDGLPAAPQLTLKVASVLGRTFSSDVLESVHPIDEYREQLPDQLDLLDRLDLTQLVAGNSDLSYRFKHDLTQEVAYELLPVERKQQIHERVATWYEQTGGDEIDQVIPLLAHHWKNAAVFPRAMEYLVIAGREALGSGAYTEAIRDLTDAVEINEQHGLVDDPLLIAHWQFLIGTAYRSGGHLEASLTHHLEVLDRLDRAPPRSVVAGLVSQTIRQLLTRLTKSSPTSRKAATDQLAALTYEELYPIYYHLAEPTRTIYSVLRNVNLSERAPLPPQLARAYAAMASTAGYSSLHALAERYIALAYEQLRVETDRTDQGRVDQLVHIYRAGVGGRWEETEEIATEAVRLFEPVGDRRWLENLSLLSVIVFYRGQLTRARTLSEDMYAEALRRGDPQMRAIGLCEQAQIALVEGRIEDAASHLDRADDLATLQGRNELIWIRGLQARLALRQGKIEEALLHASAGNELTRGLPLGYYALEGYSGIAETFMSAWDQGGHSGSGLRQMASVSVRALKRFGRAFPLGVPRARLWRGEYLWLSGRRRAATRVWERGIRDAIKTDLVYDEAALRFRLARRLPADAAERDEHLERAEALLSGMGARYPL